MLAMMLDEDGDDFVVFLMVMVMVLVVLYVHASAWRRRFDWGLPYFFDICYINWD